MGVGVAGVADSGGAALDVGVGEGVAGVVLGAVAAGVAVGSGCFCWRGCCRWRFVWVLLVALLVWVSQSVVLGVGLGVVGRWVLLGVGPRHSWLRAWWAVLLVGLPFRPSGASGGPAPLLVEGVGFFGFSCVVCVCGAGGARTFVCCVCLWGPCWWRPWWCVLCARGCVCGVLVVPLGARPRLSGLGLAALCGCGGCMSWPLSRRGCGACVWLPATPGWGLLVVVCSPAVPFACPPRSSSVPRRLSHCSPGALSGSSRAVVGVLWGWVGGGVLDAGSGPFLWGFPLGGLTLAVPVRV